MPTRFKSGGRPIRLHVTEPSTPGPHPAILLLHGAGGNVSFWLDRVAPAVAGLGIAVFAVHYFDRTDTTRADPALLADGITIPLWLETIRDALTYIARQPGVDPNRIALVGVSLGAFLSLSLGVRAKSADAAPIRAVVDISGGLMPPWDAQATSAFPPTLILHGDADSVVPAAHAHALDALLTRLRVPHQLEIFSGEGHWFSTPSQFRILSLVAAFLQRHL